MPGIKAAICVSVSECNENVLAIFGINHQLKYFNTFNASKKKITLDARSCSHLIPYRTV